MKPAAIVLSVVALAAAVFVAGPVLLTTSTGRPFTMECHGVSAAECEEALSHWSERFEEERGRSGPIVAFRYESYTGSATCGDVEIAYWIDLPIPPFLEFSQPFC